MGPASRGADRSFAWRSPSRRLPGYRSPDPDTGEPAEPRSCSPADRRGPGGRGGLQRRMPGAYSREPRDHVRSGRPPAGRPPDRSGDCREHHPHPPGVAPGRPPHRGEYNGHGGDRGGLEPDDRLHGPRPRTGVRNAAPIAIDVSMGAYRGKRSTPVESTCPWPGSRSRRGSAVSSPARQASCTRRERWAAAA